MNRQQFKEKLKELIEEFDKEIDTFTNMPEELELPEWMEQFTFYLDKLKDE